MQPLNLVHLLSTISQQENFSELIQQAQILASKLGTSETKENSNKQVSELSEFMVSEFKKLDIQQQKVDLSNQMQAQKVQRLYVDGVFDLTHSGHYNALRQAKQFAETLVCGVVAHDDVCRRKGTPILTLDERVALVNSCKFVDEVVPGVPYDATIELLDQLKCSHIAHGDDLILSPDGTDSYQPFKDANRMIIFKRTEGISTTDIVGRLLLMSKRWSSHQLELQIKQESSGQLASKIKSDDLDQQQQQQQKQEDEPKKKSIKMLNTTRRIRHFSADHKEPQPGDKIVYLDGSFDLMHVGHMKIIEAARKCGDYLIVGVHDDETINQVKGDNFPILQLQERVLNVLANKNVNEVIIGAPWKITEQMVKQFNLQVIVEGTMTKFKEHEVQQNLDESQDPYAVPKKLGIYKQIESGSKMSTETIIERIVNNRLQYLEIYNKKAKKEENYYQQERKTQEN